MNCHFSLYIFTKINACTHSFESAYKHSIDILAAAKHLRMAKHRICSTSECIPRVTFRWKDTVERGRVVLSPMFVMVDLMSPFWPVWTTIIRYVKSGGSTWDEGICVRGVGGWVGGLSFFMGGVQGAKPWLLFSKHAGLLGSVNWMQFLWGLLEGVVYVIDVAVVGCRVVWIGDRDLGGDVAASCKSEDASAVSWLATAYATSKTAILWVGGSWMDSLYRGVLLQCGVGFLVIVFGRSVVRDSTVTELLASAMLLLHLLPFEERWNEVCRGMESEIAVAARVA